MTIEIDYDKAIELLERAVAEKGKNYIYPRNMEGPSCAYVRDGQPSCIVGHVISYLAPDLLDEIHMWELDAMSDEGGSTVLALVAAFKGKLSFSPDAARVLREVQDNQDVGIPWGSAVEYAR